MERLISINLIFCKMNDCFFANQDIGILGFNTRPIACSVARQGGKVFVSDYWGDSDLQPCVKKWVSVLNPQPGYRQRKKLDRPMQEYLVQNFLEYYGHSDYDHIFITGGFDDYTIYLKELEKRYRISGNSSKQMKLARDFQKVNTLATELGLRVPLQKLSDSLDTSLSIADEIGYPCILRALESGGGSGIRFIKDQDDLITKYKKIQPGSRMRIQQYVTGKDASVSLLSTGTKAMSLSYHGQMIGFPSAGLKCNFTFSGNFMPFSIESETRKKLTRTTERMMTELGLVGSNGIDVVLDDAERIWFMEINPRFQATLEMLEYAGKVSITKLHVDACEGYLPRQSPKFTAACKMIVYSQVKGVVGDLSRIPETVDRTPIGVHVNRYDPICSLIYTGISINEVYKKAIHSSEEVRRLVEPMKD
ncbi:MAG: ATP-grasp domain-containing protein [Candidatus Lokiarchaeota archaeon]|nr:ATP-grasp domain-containing protein [Candidatus Lokiarchaeota archaeon]